MIELKDYKQIKLHFTDPDLQCKFITHLEQLPLSVKVIFIPKGTAVLLAYPLYESNNIFYKDQLSFVKNDPIVAVGVCCEVEPLTDYDHGLIEAKFYTLLNMRLASRKRYFV